MVLTMQRISAEDLRERMKSDNCPVVINALTEDAFMAKHIPGSINIPEENAEMAENILPVKNQDIVVYCANADCDASPNLAEKLMDMGYKNVWDFEEGLAGWRRAGYNLMGNEV